MTTITYTHNPNDTVWFLTYDCGIMHGTVQSFGATVTAGPTTVLKYGVVSDDDVLYMLSDVNVFAESDLAGALLAYEAQLTA